MKLSDCFVMGAFNELINFPFEDVRAAFNQFEYYVAMGKEESFIKEVVQVKNWYSEELKKIEKYTQEEYTDLVNSGEGIPEYDEPSFMIKEVEIQIKSQLIEVISKYFDRDVFEKNKILFFKHEVFKEQSVETPHELWVSLNVHKDHIYSILSILGYYQRHKGYFLSQSDFYKIACSSSPPPLTHLCCQ